MRSLFFLFLTFSVFLVNGQSKDIPVIYLDHNNKQITLQEYKNLVRLRATLLSTIKTDSLIYKRITLRYEFGQLSLREFNQIKQLISNRSSKLVKEKEYIIISVIDSLHDYDSYVKNYITSHHYNFDPSLIKTKVVSKYNGKMVNNSRLYMLDKDSFKKKQSKHLIKRSKCIRNIEKKYDSQVFHLINHNFSIIDLSDGLNIIDDSGILKRKFIPYINGNRVIIIKPDGEYFITTNYNSKLEKALLENKDWSKAKDKLLKIIKENSLFEQHGIFYAQNTNNCFRK
jgi:hypothetical protein